MTLMPIISKLIPEAMSNSELIDPPVAIFLNLTTYFSSKCPPFHSVVPQLKICMTVAHITISQLLLRSYSRKPLIVLLNPRSFFLCL